MSNSLAKTMQLNLSVMFWGCQLSFAEMMYPRLLRNFYPPLIIRLRRFLLHQPCVLQWVTSTIQHSVQLLHRLRRQLLKFRPQKLQSAKNRAERRQEVLHQNQTLHLLQGLLNTQLKIALISQVPRLLHRLKLCYLHRTLHLQLRVKLIYLHLTPPPVRVDLLYPPLILHRMHSLGQSIPSLQQQIKCSAMIQLILQPSTGCLCPQMLLYPQLHLPHRLFQPQYRGLDRDLSP
mmetsp:Transcript_12878/g.27112  ORF Transcript_12878/g.27112 Transcript_12878/m.27112 type:complete len:233 (-) Transcript_12878:3212-3910(-)